MKWSELKAFCNELPDEVLDKDVELWREYSGVNNINAMQLEEDYYLDSESRAEGCVSKSELGEDVSGFEKVYSKGDAVLWEKV